MASLYRRPDSPYFWVSFLDLRGQRKCKGTHLRHTVPGDVRKARELCSELSDNETRRISSEELWDSWVPRLLEQRYENSPATLRRYSTAWRNIIAFLEDKHIPIPRALTRQHVRDYVEWRQIRHPDLGVYEVSKNTALHEIKLLRILMFEAVQNGFALVNPCERLAIAKDAPALKPRIADAENDKIVAALANEPEWMRVSYQIAWHSGCRFSETHLHLPTQVDLKREVMRLRVKGHKSELTEFPLSERLAPLFRSLIEQGREWTFTMPDMPGKEWWRFFKRIRLPHLCFHCTRVTFVTRCYEAGISREHVMRLVGHSTYAVHQVYPRLSASGDHLQAMRQLLDRRTA